MNREITELREVVQKLVPMLAGRGLTVTQRGSQAYVKTNTKTRKPEIVNIPNISDNAKPDFIEAIQGFIDHEVGHVLHTDWNFYGRAPTSEDLAKVSVQQFMNSHNIVEDVMIEREMGKTFPGSKRNISRTRKYFLSRITEPAVKSAGADEKKQFIYLLVPTMRALGGHEEMIEWMDEGGYWKNKYVADVVRQLKPETIELLKSCSNTEQTLAIAEEMHAILYPPKPPAPPAPPEPDPSEEEEGDEAAAPSSPKKPSAKPADPEPEDKPDEEAGGGDGTGERDHTEPAESGEKETGSVGKDDDEDDTPGKAKTTEPETEEEEDTSGGDTDDDDDEPSSSDDDMPEVDGGDLASALHSPPEPEEDDTDGAGEDGSDEEEGAGWTPPGSAGGDVSEDDDDDTHGDDSDDGGSSGFRSEGDEGGGVGNIDVDEDGDESKGGHGGGVGNEAAKSLFDFDEDAFDEADMSSQIGILISEEAVLAMDPKQYLVFTREADRIEPIEPPDEMNETWVPKMEDEVRQMTAKMRKDIERIMASQSHVIRTPGHKRGKLHSPSLFRVSQGDPRVFSQKQEHTSKDTAVCLLADNSGSMWGEKMKLAMIASYALMATLDAVKIPHEVLGFTSGDYSDMPYSLREAMQADIEKSKINYDRIEPIMIPIYKAFDERLNATVKRRFAYMMNAQNGLNGNIDGESLEYAAERLMKRREKRKVMIVLSDGQPAGSDKSGPHLSYVTRQLEKQGIECIGIGILDGSVRKYYSKHVVLRNVEELPNEVMTEIKKLLM
ncbi:cobaltochelatase CobT-related protein [Agrobacterium sp. CG674]